MNSSIVEKSHQGTRKSRAKTPKTMTNLEVDLCSDRALREQHFQFLRTFESKKDAYLQNYYESQKKI